ncbi:hypothetical protein L208DRAFT_277599 [Tricholoma matsutake]|nr:hypothetical protein L208DRAFT_277599 [Tricholoma matsutake 945]
MIRLTSRETPRLLAKPRTLCRSVHLRRAVMSMSYMTGTHLFGVALPVTALPWYGTDGYIADWRNRPTPFWHNQNSIRSIPLRCSKAAQRLCHSFLPTTISRMQQSETRIGHLPITLTIKHLIIAT